MTEANNKFMKRNIIGGLIIVLLGIFFLAISGANYLWYLGMKNDIQVEPCEGCEPFDKPILDAAIGSGILGGLMTAVGLVFFFYGLRQSQASNPSR
jgi:drug/metabolite transporter (DMT)-like permease